MRTLLFDIDGTLLISAGGGRRAFSSALALEFGVRDTLQDLCFAGRTDAGLIVDMLRRHGLPTDPEHRGRLRRRYAMLLPGELTKAGGWVLPGVIELLTLLNAEPRVRLAVMTGNLPETATRKLEHFSLMGYFRFIVSGDLDEDRGDMARRASAQVLARFGPAAGEDLVVIGDTPDDIRCGHLIGAPVVAVCTGNYGRDELAAEHPHVLLEDLSDVRSACSLLSNGIRRHSRIT